MVHANAQLKFDTVSVEEKILGMCLGVAVGDALGLPFECQTAAEIAKHASRIDRYFPPSLNHYFSGTDPELPLGTTSDDTQLTVAMCEALTKAGYIQLDFIASEHVATIRESTLGWGPTTKQAVERLSNGVHWSSSGERGKGFGNGVIMKLGPVAALDVLTGKEWRSQKGVLASLTCISHATNEAICATFAHLAVLEYLLTVRPASFRGADLIARAIEAGREGERFIPEIEPATALVERLHNLPRLVTMDRDAIAAACGGADSRVTNCLPHVIAMFVKNPDEWSAVEETIFAGGDTDSTAALVGSYLGALHGPSIVPEHLVAALPAASKVADAVNRFLRRFR